MQGLKFRFLTGDPEGPHTGYSGDPQHFKGTRPKIAQN